MQVAQREHNAKSSQVPDVKVDILGVSHRFNNVHAVNNVSLSVRSGVFLTLLGNSGSGKTTLLRIVAGLKLLTGLDPFAGARAVAA